MKRLSVLFGILISTICYADTETTNWYVNGELYDTTSCQSGGNIDVPTTPSKRGYTFQGWEPAIYDISTLDPTINGTSRREDNRKWRVIFPYGAIYGEVLCSSTSTNEWYTNVTLNTTQDSGTNCYCRVTEFIPTGSKKIYEPASAPWVYTFPEYGNCKVYCQYNCALQTLNTASFRSQLFGSN